MSVVLLVPQNIMAFRATVTHSNDLDPFLGLE
jgi:hypothetical protein